MNKLKLIQIIFKDLEELKTLTEEISENQDDTYLIADLALSRAKLLCQEIELLRGFSEKPESEEFAPGDETFENDDNEEINVSTSEPELEILHYEPGESPEEVESSEEENIVYDSEEEEELEDEDLTEDKELDEESEEDEIIDPENETEEFETHDLEDVEEEIVIEESHHELEEPKRKEEASLSAESNDVNEIKTIHQPEVREISMDELDDEDDEPMQFSPVSGLGNRPVMREIPKPEDQENEKELVGKSFQKEQSLNDSIGESKPEETSLGSGPISSLRSAIGLNDRFLFIREIFSNNTEKYNTVIEQLDKLETIQEAVDYLKVNLSLQKNDTSLRFVELLKRRFIK